jgi:hypothetical protein
VSGELERDLGAWARGELARERLLATHGAAGRTIALHDRLTMTVGAIPIPDPDAGWAALLVEMERAGSVAPLRRRDRPIRTVSILVAAALALLAGAAFAAAFTSSHRGETPSRPATGPSVARPVHPTRLNDRRPMPVPTPRPVGGARPHATTPRRSAPTGGPARSGGPAGADDPRDRHRGTGNDGSHDDRGSGNNGPSGTLPPASHGRGR